MQLNLLRFLCAAFVFVFPLAMNEVFALSAKSVKVAVPAASAVATASGSADNSGSGTTLKAGFWGDDDEQTATGKIEQEREKQKTMEDVNAFLIESYKIKLDKILEDVYTSIRTSAKDDPKIQVIILDRIVQEIDSKLSALESKNISANRKKILSAVFMYLKDSIRDKIADLSKEK